MKKLKAILITFLAIGTVLNFSCSKDNHDNPPNNSIIGTWQITKSTEEGQRTKTVGNKTTVLEEINETNEYNSGITIKITFNADGTYLVNNYGMEENEDQSGKYSLKDNKLTIKYIRDGENSKEKIEVLDIAIAGNQMTMISHYEESNTDNSETQPVTYTTKIKDTSYLKRIK